MTRSDGGGCHATGAGECGYPTARSMT
jgi:hypothetical protein